MTKIAVTGLGVVCPIANSINELSQAIQKGNSGIGDITRYDTKNEDIKIAGEVKNCKFSDYISKKSLMRAGRASKLGIIASRQAIEDSHIDVSKENSDIAVIVATAIGETDKLFKYYDNLTRDSNITNTYFTLFSNDVISSYISIDLNIKGINYAISGGCSSFSIALQDAINLLKLKKYKYVLIIGTEAPINKYIIKSLFKCNILSQTGIRPFDKTADGFVVSEGAGAMLLELEETAINRGAKVYSNILGTGYTSDSYSVFSEPPNLNGKKDAIIKALNESEISYDDINYINVYGCGLRHIDLEEISLINQVFGERQKNLYISSTKSMVGHMLGASAAIESISTILGLKDNFIPPTINLVNKDENCNFNLVQNTVFNKTINIALKLSYASGNKNTAIIMERGLKHCK